MRKTLALGAALTLAAGLAACSKPAGYGKDFGQQVHAYLIDHPEVLEEMQYAGYVKQQKLAVERMRPLIQKYKAQIFSDARDPFVGPAKAKVTVVQFFDYRCPHCKREAASAVLALIKKYPDVRFVFKEFPIFGAPSQAAARAGLAAWKSGHYLPVFAELMARPEIDEQVIREAWTKAGIDPVKAGAIAATPAVESQVADVVKLAANLGVDGTPAFIIGDTPVNGADMEKVEDLIKKARAA